MKSQVRENLISYALLAPSLAVFIVFLWLPILGSFYISLSEWKIFGPPTFVGLQNYRGLLGNSLFWLSIRNTAVYSLIVVPSLTSIPLVFALLLNQKLVGRGILRAALYVPVISSTVIAALVWKWIYDGNVGVVNYVLGLIGLQPRIWLGDPRTALPAVAVSEIWKNAGYYMVIYLAGLQSIPSALYEAAKIDGANMWQRLRFITLPLMLPTILIVVILSTIFNFQVFESIYVMTSGGPANATTTVGWQIYKSAFHSIQFGTASCMAFVLFLFVFVLASIEKRAMRFQVEY